MVQTSRPIAALLVTLLALGAGGCARVPGHQGFIADAPLVDAIQPGIDNRESVTKTLGRPSFIGQFTPNDWYYVSRNTKQLAFAVPTPTEQLVLRIQFDNAGNVQSVGKSGLEKVARINPEGDKTPTLGRDRSFFEELFGNIGSVGAVGGGAASADNPDG
jgi:outer membrane protein assembly factor BamE (lipoprotein component of BamABCDE complex)